MKPNPETFWARLQERRALSHHLEAQAAEIPEPDFAAVFARAKVLASARIRGPAFVLPLFAALVAGFVVVFLAVPSNHPLGSKTSALSVVDQVFLSTSPDPETRGGIQDLAGFSTVLKSIDAGISRWDVPPVEE